MSKDNKKNVNKTIENNNVNETATVNETEAPKRERLFNETTINNLIESFNNNNLEYVWIKPKGLETITLPSSYHITMVYGEDKKPAGFTFETKINGLGKMQSFDCKSAKYAEQVRGAIAEKIILKYQESQ